MAKRFPLFGAGEAALLLIVLSACSPRGTCQNKLEVAPPQKSDTIAEDDAGRKFRVQHGELPAGNFQIAGVDLASEVEVLKQAARILGPAGTRATGDAADYDERACYRPVDKNDTTRLYFHRGEVSPWFVLSSTTPASERNDVCRSSSKITRDISTVSGLHLGQTQEQVISILGLPTRRSHDPATARDVMAYEYETRRRASADKIARAREQNPNMSEEALFRSFGFYDLEELIEVKFSSRILTELKVSWTGTD